MSAIIVIPVLLPMATPVLWPLCVAAATSAAAVMGYALTKNSDAVDVADAVEIELENADEVMAMVGEGESVCFTNGTETIVFSRDSEGKTSVKVHGDNLSKEQLRQIGEEFAKKVVQQYVYNRLVNEMEKQHFNLVEQDVDDDGTVRLKVRAYRE